MTERTVWTCDGCYCETVVADLKKTDWHRITVNVQGFTGYPVGDYANGERSYELCPACQRRLAEVCRPGNWARAALSEDKP